MTGSQFWRGSVAVTGVPAYCAWVESAQMTQTFQPEKRTWRKCAMSFFCYLEQEETHEKSRHYYGQ